MSVMLKTTNPEAVAEIEGGRDHRVPYVGQALIFHARPGEGRGGKHQIAAICTHVHDEEHVELLAMFAADDFITRMKIPRKTDQNPVNAWSFNDWDEVHYQRVPAKALSAVDVETLITDKLKPLSSKITSLEGELRRLVKAQG